MKTDSGAVRCAAYDLRVRAGGSGGWPCPWCHPRLLHHRCRHRPCAGTAEYERRAAPGIHHQGDDAGPCCEKAQGNWDDIKLTVTHEDVYSLAGTDSSHIALREGEEVPLTDALYATQMASANDGANLLAEYVERAPSRTAWRR
mgnify:CR=1 FL=1